MSADLPEVGEIWEQVAGEFVGRRGVVVAVSQRVTLDPYPGTCPCPLKQRRTQIQLPAFQMTFRRYRRTTSEQAEPTREAAAE